MTLASTYLKKAIPFHTNKQQVRPVTTFIYLGEFSQSFVIALLQIVMHHIYTVREYIWCIIRLNL